MYKENNNKIKTWEQLEIRVASITLLHNFEHMETLLLSRPTQGYYKVTNLVVDLILGK